MPFHLPRRGDKGLVSHEVYRRPRSWIKLLWVVGTAFAGFYLIFVYLLPLIGVVSLPMVPLKGFVEVIICFIPVITGLLMTTRKVRLQNPVVRVARY
jgi:hypothetical protein